jgi:serine/threonine-protein kinase RsbW
VTNSRHTLNWAAPPDDVNAVHDFLESIWSHFPEVDSTDRMIFETAIVELASNVIEHAAPWQGGVSCVLHVQIVDNALRAELRDTAQAGAFRLSDRAMPGAEAESGRGLALIQAMVDSVSFERTGEFNLWTITKSLDN